VRLTKEELSIRVLVRRRASGAAPSAWEIHQTDIYTPIYISPERFRSMEAAYQAGQARLKEFIPQRTAEPDLVAA
jgi:hypothetical protein